MEKSNMASSRMRLASYVLCVLVLGLHANSASAQCAFARPKKASTYQVSLVPAFQGCESGTCADDSGLTCHDAADCAGTPICEGSLGDRNASTEGGVMTACQPPQLWPGGAAWFWDPTSTSGRIQMKPRKNKVFDNVVTDPNGRDIAILVTLTGVRDAMGQPANASGSLTVLVRWTLQDRMNGDMTMINFPLTKYMTLSNGKGKLKFSANESLSEFGGMIVAGLPGCTVTQVLKVELRDENGVPFAAPGLL